MSDKAERLHKLVDKIMDTANQQGLYSVLLWQSVEPIAIQLGYESYIDLVEQYFDLCASVKADVLALDLRKEAVRTDMINCVDKIRNVFNASNFQHTTQDMFARHVTPNLPTLNMISERLQASDILESTQDELEDALKSVESAILEIEKSDKIDKRIVRILMHLLEQMRHTYANYEIFGDDKFWKIYKETFATFVQLHNVILESENSAEILAKVTAAAKSLMGKTIVGINVASGIATVAQLFIASSAG